MFFFNFLSSTNHDSRYFYSVTPSPLPTPIPTLDLLSCRHENVNRFPAINNVIMGNLNINSLPKQFNDLKAIITGMLDIVIITETRLDNQFSVFQFHIDRYSKPYRLDRNRNGSGIIIYVREDISSIMLTKQNFPDNIKGTLMQI